MCLTFFGDKSAVCRWVGTSIGQSQPQGGMRRNPTCTQDWKIVEGRPMMAGSLLAIIMMTQGDGAKLLKACSTRTHMGGAPGFLIWSCSGAANERTNCFQFCLEVSQRFNEINCQDLMAHKNYIAWPFHQSAAVSAKTYIWKATKKRAAWRG